MACIARPCIGAVFPTNPIRSPAAVRSRPVVPASSPSPSRWSRTRCAASRRSSPSTSTGRAVLQQPDSGEQAHIAAAFRFELSKYRPGHPVPRVSSCACVGGTVRAGGRSLGHGVARGMPRVLPSRQARDRPSPALSMMALPRQARRGDSRWRSSSVTRQRRPGGGAAAALLRPRGRPAGRPAVGMFTAADGSQVDADASFENEPSVCCVDRAIPDGEGTASCGPATAAAARVRQGPVSATARPSWHWAMRCPSSRCRCIARRGRPVPLLQSEPKKSFVSASSRTGAAQALRPRGRSAAAVSRTPEQERERRHRVTHPVAFFF